MCELADQKFRRCIEAGIAYANLKNCQQCHHGDLAASLALNNIAGTNNTIEDDVAHVATTCTSPDVVHDYSNSMMESQDTDDFSCDSQPTNEPAETEASTEYISSDNDSDATAVICDRVDIALPAKAVHGDERKNTILTANISLNLDENRSSTHQITQNDRQLGIDGSRYESKQHNDNEESISINQTDSTDSPSSKGSSPSNHSLTSSRAVDYNIASLFPEDTRSDTISMSDLKDTDNFSCVPQSTNEPEADKSTDQSASSDNDSEAPPQRRRRSAHTSSRFVISRSDNHCDITPSMESQDSARLAFEESHSTSDCVEPEPSTLLNCNEHVKASAAKMKKTKLNNLFPYQCDICMRAFKRSHILQTHTITHEPLNKLHTCVVCKKSFQTKQYLQQHKLIHFEKSYECNTCSKTFSVLRSLARHKKVHLVKPFHCNICKQMYKTEPEKTKHMRVHQKITYTCDICQKSYERYSSFYRHNMTHLDDPSRECALCNKVLSRPELLRKHRELHEEKPYCCDICKKMVKSKREIKIHMLVHRSP